MKVLTSLMVVIFCSSSLSVQGQECRTFYTCSDCFTKNASCAWCDDQEVFTRIKNDLHSQLRPAELCGTVDELLDLGCDASRIYNPTGSVALVNEGGDAVDVEKGFVLPREAAVDLRPGVPSRLNITVAPAKNVSVDMYVLVDLSFTMSANVDNVRDRGALLVNVMRNLTENFRIAFGTFVDKPLDPFIERRSRDTPCNHEGRAAAMACVPTYTFRHELNFTSDTDQFIRAVDSVSLSGSADHPEAVFDALLQIAACDEGLIDWSPSGDTRRIVWVMTDGDYHYALDGKLAGLFKRPTKECRLNPINNTYDYSTRVDFPSLSFIDDILNEKRISTIFTVTDNVKDLYTNINEIIRNAIVGNLVGDSFDLVREVEDLFKRLTTTVVPIIVGADEINGLEVEAAAVDCGAGGTVLSSDTATCGGVVFPDRAMYEVSLKVSPDFCDQPDLESPHDIRVLFVGFGEVSIRFTAQCSCPCEADRVVDSPQCNGNGDFECSTCVCKDNFVGSSCGCPQTLTAALGCSSDRDISTICSNKGTCVCSNCQCDRVPTLGNHTYQGRYCECDPFNCPHGISENGQRLPCSGHGTCGCDSQCSCDPGYSGFACDCPESISSCIRRGEDQVCSGAGQCVCGVCICNDYSQRRGEFCEECLSCRRACSMISDCVECLITENCGQECNNVSLTHNPADISAYNNTNFGFRNCSVVNSNCEVVYQIDQNLEGVENLIQVFINEDQRSFNTWRDSPSNCQPPTSVLIYVIPVSIVLLIVIIAILALAGWKGITLFAEYVEYKSWEKSQRNEQWNTSGDNPLFIDPTASYKNPKYRRPVQFIDSY